MEFAINILGLIFLGFASQLISKFFPPERKIVEKPNRFLDVVGFASTQLFSLFLLLVLQPVHAWLSEVELIMESRQIMDELPWWALILSSVVLTDFMGYWNHRLLHCGWIWHVHAFHHSSKVIDWVSGLRNTFGQVIVTSITLSVVSMILSFDKAIGVVVITSIFTTLFGQHLIHSNIRLPYQRIIERIFVTPRYHLVHHSVDRKYSDSNFGFVFSIWDRLFGTYVNPDSVPDDAPLGLSYENTDLRLLLCLPPRLGAPSISPEPVVTNEMRPS